MSTLDISLETFCQKLVDAQLHLAKHNEDALTEAAKLVEHQAREPPGGYEAGWPELAQ